MLPMSFMLSCSSKRRFSIFRSLLDKERKEIEAFTVPVFTLDNLSEPPSSYNAKAEEVSPPHAPTHTQRLPSQCGSRRVIFQGLLSAFRSLLSLRNPVIHL